NDFIELYNAGSTTVDLSTYAVQYASATSGSWSETILSGSILPGQHYLIQEAQGTGGTLNLPTPQAIGTISLSATSGKVALTKTQTLLTGNNPVGNSNLVDFVGFGTADAYEGAGAAPTLTNTTAALRGNSGGTDTNNNSSDFTAGSPNPRNN
ncbi:MAG TPA: lamin tail domain-containing protein, partial [Chthoniobacterales bacterium]|nr:lamin tail domain-containing protein [Chthoniobacterales bacterium]